MGEVLQLRHPLRTPAWEYDDFVQRMLDLAAEQPERASEVMAALAEAEERRVRLTQPWLSDVDPEAVSADPGSA